MIFSRESFQSIEIIFKIMYNKVEKKKYGGGNEKKSVLFDGGFALYGNALFFGVFIYSVYFVQ